MSSPIRRGRGARAFSLVEAVISTVIVATMFAAAITAAGVAARDRRIQAEQRTGEALARMLMSEIMAQRYADPGGGTILGRDANKLTDSRATWTDVDDYNTLYERPRARSGDYIESVEDWSWGAKVEYFTIPPLGGVNSATPTNDSLVIAIPLLGISIPLSGLDVVAPADTGMKRVTVTVTSPRGVVTRQSALRSAWGSANDAASGTGACMWAGLSLKVGPEQRPVVVGTEMLNRPQP